MRIEIELNGELEHIFTTLRENSVIRESNEEKKPSKEELAKQLIASSAMPEYQKLVMSEK